MTGCVPMSGYLQKLLFVYNIINLKCFFKYIYNLIIIYYNLIVIFKHN